MSRIVVAIIGCLLLACHQRTDWPATERGFYYWRQHFVVDSAGQQWLQVLDSRHLYVRFFDVVWDDDSRQPQPVAKLDGRGSFPAGQRLVPVVFITNETLVNANADQLETLALQIERLLRSMLANRPWPAPAEIQIDCDWTRSTRDRFFLLLKQLRKTDLFQNKQLSATIRLHQLKFRNESGIPPVDKGLLMCYNMGNLLKSDTRNSILEPAVLKQYIGFAATYPLALDVALPVFSWYVWFRDNRFHALIADTGLAVEQDERATWRCLQDTVINGFTFRAGDWLRHEACSVSDLTAAAALIRQSLREKPGRVLLYHLDDRQLSNYDKADLEAVLSLLAD